MANGDFSPTQQNETLRPSSAPLPLRPPPSLQLRMPPKPRFRKLKPKRTSPRADELLAPPQPPPSCHGLPSIYRRDFHGDRRSWNAAREQAIAAHYQAAPLAFDGADLHPYSFYLDEYRFEERASGHQLVTEDCWKLFYDVQGVPAYEKRYADPWRAMTEVAREEIILAALWSMPSEVEGDARPLDRIRLLMLELTLNEMAGDGGDRFLTLVNRLLANFDNPFTFSVVRNASFERHCDFRFDVGKNLVPRNKIIRVLQQHLFNLRHMNLLLVVRHALSLIVSLSFQLHDDKLTHFAAPASRSRSSTKIPR